MHAKLFSVNFSLYRFEKCVLVSFLLYRCRNAWFLVVQFLLKLAVRFLSFCISEFMLSVQWKTGRTPLLKELNLPVSGATSALEFCNGLLT